MALSAEFPLSSALLERYKIISRRRSRPSLVGGHQMRRKGQSLEFRDFVPYAFGDDIRYVDWRMSARYGSENDLLVRQFAAEEQITLVISIDTRATMELPEAMPKSLIAMWLAQALAFITLESDDRIILHRLFGLASDSIAEIKGSKNTARIRSAMKRTLKTPDENIINLKILEQYLPPTAVWLIVTDLYFDSESHQLVRRIAGARDGLRWIILMDMDSWPHEKFIMGQGARRIQGPGMDLPNPQFDITPESIQLVEKKIESHKQEIFKRIRPGSFDRIHWKWPITAKPDPVDFFKTAFFEDNVLQRLFMRQG
ncbi:MAG: DUF58 domain-containing protein [Desulfobacteraceae bacterium]|nr:DUF58 domain-containing protein [Desulfobacteraceae bacterium]